MAYLLMQLHAPMKHCCNACVSHCCCCCSEINTEREHSLPALFICLLVFSPLCLDKLQTSGGCTCFVPSCCHLSFFITELVQSMNFINKTCKICDSHHHKKMKKVEESTEIALRPPNHILDQKNNSRKPYDPPPLEHPAGLVA
ncbi:hypothetical protein J3E68DRAFT_408495 [Trichoderma sp. SZMC 28012]